MLFFPSSNSEKPVISNISSSSGFDSDRGGTEKYLFNPDAFFFLTARAGFFFAKISLNINKKMELC